MNAIRIAILSDYAEEGWPSMDLVAEMLAEGLRLQYASSFSVDLIRPEFHRRLSLLPGLRNKLILDRIANRYFDYPVYLRSRIHDFDLFHITDHSYSQLVHDLPPGRVVVTCHDLDTFRCLLNPSVESHNLLFRRLVRRTLTGFQKAAMICCDTTYIMNEILKNKLAPSNRLVVVPNGKASEFFVNNKTACDDGMDLIHVGSTIPRKRIDLLIRIVAEVRKSIASIRLIRVGGAFTRGQRELIERLGIQDSIVEMPFLSREQLADAYRKSTILVLPSEREGFALPVIEAMGCGTPAIVTDHPAICETGGSAAEYCPFGDVNAWARKVISLLQLRKNNPAAWQQLRMNCIAHAAKFQWSETVKSLVQVYMKVLSSAGISPAPVIQ